MATHCMAVSCSWSQEGERPRERVHGRETTSGRKLSRIRATSSHRKYAVSGIQLAVDQRHDNDSADEQDDDSGDRH